MGRHRRNSSSRAGVPPRLASAHSAQGDRATSAVPTPATPLDIDDTLAEIFLRLPPLPSALPRASMICRRWRALVSDPYFLGRFRAHHHRNPPLLGFFFHHRTTSITFTPALDPPDRVPAARFSLQLDKAKDHSIHSCRHGRVLFVDWTKLHFLVWEPITGNQRRVPLPPSFDSKARDVLTSAIVCSAAGRGNHVHGACCHSRPFQVIFLGCTRRQIYAYVYSSETDGWSSVVATCPRRVSQFSLTSCPSVLVGNSLCWLLCGTPGAIIVFDLERQSLDAIDLPSCAFNLDAFLGWRHSYLVMPADGGGICFLALSGFSAQQWKREVNSGGVNGWVLGKTIELDRLLCLRSDVNVGTPWIVAFDENDNAIFVRTDSGVFRVHLQSMQFKKLPETLPTYRHYHPFTSFYSAARGRREKPKI